MDTHPEIRSQVAGLRADELRRQAAEARLAARVRQGRHGESEEDQVLLAGRSLRILLRRFAVTLPKPQV